MRCEFQQYSHGFWLQRFSGLAGGTRICCVRELRHSGLHFFHAWPTKTLHRLKRRRNFGTTCSNRHKIPAPNRGVFIRRFRVGQAPHGIMRMHQPSGFLEVQFWSLASQRVPGFRQVDFDLVASVLNLPPLASREPAGIRRGRSRNAGSHRAKPVRETTQGLAFRNLAEQSHGDHIDHRLQRNAAPLCEAMMRLIPDRSGWRVIAARV